MRDLSKLPIIIVLLDYVVYAIATSDIRFMKGLESS